MSTSFYARLAGIFVALFIFQNIEAQTFTGTGGPIPDDGTLAVYTIEVSGLPDSIDGSFGLESVCVNLTHTWNADLFLRVESPDGTVVQLLNGIGGDTDGFENLCLSSNASTSIFEAQFPFTGTFKPMGDMGAINNKQNPNGTWKLLVLDTYAFADAGTLFDWSISFGNQPCQPFPFESSDLPIIEIYTDAQFIPNEPKIPGTLRMIYNGPGNLNYLHQPDAYYEGAIGIETHGNSTQGFPKKSYDIELRDTAGQDMSVEWLDLPSGSDFVLGANFSDKTLMRNALTYQLANELGQYAPRTRFCEVFVDNTYQGVYTLTEKIRRDKNRVDIPKLSPADTMGVELTGGYICKVDWVSTPGWGSQFPIPNNNGIFPYFQHVYPRADEIKPAQANYIRQYVDSFEVALHGPDFQDSLLGWRPFFDETSLLEYMFMNEISNNVDGYRLSTYFHKQRDDKGGKLRMGPVWDYDLAWYNSNYCNGDATNVWAYNINYVCNDAGVPFWWERLMQDSLFAQDAACHWQKMRSGPLSRPHIFSLIDSMAAVLQQGQERNFDYWPILGIYIWPNPGPLPTTYAGEITKLKAWITSRLLWLDAAFFQYHASTQTNFTVTPAPTGGWTFTAPAPPGYTYLWTFGDGTTSTEPQPVHIYTQTGAYTVKLVLTSPYGCVKTGQKNLTFVGTTETDGRQMAITPNPAHDRLSVILPGTTGSEGVFRLYNNLGQLVHEVSLAGGENQQEIVLPVLPAGVYVVKVQYGRASWSQQVVLE